MSSEIVFVAGEVGGPGGMEHQSEQLVAGLLAAGRRVTVVARACHLPPHERLRVRRVPTPARPFVVAYPAFIAVASILAALSAPRARRVLHTTGAIIIGRADVSTVHYCHRAAQRQLAGSRASRRGLAYRINAALADLMSRLAERWCYRPERAGLLCAVSGGMAAELEREFPCMGGAVRAVPNGVDTERFRPDREARQRVRGELGLGDDDAVAVFAGGDWERKGLRHAVDALERAPGWQLLVAGAGDPDAVLAQARLSGTADRVRFLGLVTDMPALFSAADAFLLPTAYETFSLVTYEAAACGLPLLVTSVNGVEDLIVDGVNGWFISPDGSRIAERLNALGADRGLAARLGAAARESALGHSWDAMTARYLAVYAETEAETAAAALA